MKFIPKGTPVLINFPAIRDINGVEYAPYIKALTEFDVEIEENKITPFHEWYSFTNDGHMLGQHNIGFFIEKRFVK